MASTTCCRAWAGPRSARSRAEDVDPLAAGVVEVLGDEVGGVGVAAAGHGDVRRGGAGVLADEDVCGVDGLALGAVDGGGVGELDEPCRVVGRDRRVATAPGRVVEQEAAVVADAGDGPGLPVRDLEVGVVAAGRDPVSEPDPLPGSSGDHLARIDATVGVAGRGWWR